VLFRSKDSTDEKLPWANLLRLGKCLGPNLLRKNIFENGLRTSLGPNYLGKDLDQRT
jgi:hypothetical protein